MESYAHSKKDAPREQWHLLERHLRDTARRAKQFASKFNGEDCASYAGLWHDLGKYASDWQQFLIDAQTRSQDASVLGEDTPDERRVQRKRGPDHSTAGAIHARKVIRDPVARKTIEFAIAAHHAGLANRPALDCRLDDPAKIGRYVAAIRGANDSILTIPQVLAAPAWVHVPSAPEQAARSFEFFVRMIFSALVDADFLDTEEFMEVDAERSSHRKDWPSITNYVPPLEAYLAEISKSVVASRRVLDTRRAVLKWCIDSAAGSPGAYTLTVPTGGGKTLASLMFALLHARKHSLDRVVVALPFLSIVDQTVSVFQTIFAPHFGDRVLVEHHSNIVPAHDTERNRLAAENWDAPLIVTTQVQLFESLFHRRSSDCRKLHNLANSVVVLDEVQTLPLGLLEPILDALQELTRTYGASLVLTTATQPALHSRPLGASPFRGLSPEPTEIVPATEMQKLFNDLRRVDVNWPSSEGVTSWNELATYAASERQVLVIVHQRKDAAELWREINSLAAGALHLSALMCAAHRRKVLDEIRRRLERGDECRLVSTQLVEAGVDIDFPVVYRAMAGLESLAQSAGRCNREGRLARGIFCVYRAPTEPVRALKHHKEIAETMLRANRDLDLFAPSTFRSYFDRLYAEASRDEKNIQVPRQALEFETTAERFRMIDDITTPIFVPYSDAGAAAIRDFRYAGPSRERFRALQQFSVGVYSNDLQKLESRGVLELLHDSVYVLTSSRDYDDVLGIVADRDPYEFLHA